MAAVACNKLRVLDERADDERLPSGSELLAHPFVGSLTFPLGGAQERVDRLSPLGQLAQNGEIEVAVVAERERSRDRRGRHVQHMSASARLTPRALAIQRRPLLDPKPVLLVDDHDRQPVELNRLLDQRVGTDQQRQLAGRELRQEIGPPRAGSRPRQQAEPDILGSEQLLNRLKVLLGKRLGRRHQRRLKVTLDGPQHRVQRNHRLAGPDLAHQQPLHRL